MNSKAWYQSKTIWGAILTLLAPVASFLHVEVSGEDQATAVDLILQIVAGIGGIIAIVGRYAAKQRIGGGGGTPLMALLLCLMLAGCGSLNKAYIAADRQTKDAVDPLLSRYTADHPGDKQLVDDLRNSWELRLREAEAANP